MGNRRPLNGRIIQSALRHVRACAHRAVTAICSRERARGTAPEAGDASPCATGMPPVRCRSLRAGSAIPDQQFTTPGPLPHARSAFLALLAISRTGPPTPTLAPAHRPAPSAPRTSGTKGAFKAQRHTSSPGSRHPRNTSRKLQQSLRASACRDGVKCQIACGVRRGGGGMGGKGGGFET